MNTRIYHMNIHAYWWCLFYVCALSVYWSTHPNTKNTNLPVEVMRCDVLVPPTDTLSLPSSWNTIVVCMFMHCLVGMQLCLVLLWKESVWNKNHPFLFSFPVIYCGYLELCFVSASVQCFFSPRFVHSFFHVWKTSNFYFTYCTYLLSLCLSWEMCLFICVCVCPTCKSCPLPKQTVQWIISHVRRRVRHVIRLKWISFLCVSVSGCVSMYVYDTISLKCAALRWGDVIMINCWRDGGTRREKEWERHTRVRNIRKWKKWKRKLLEKS